MKIGKFDIQVKTESVGPAHDPYHRESVRVADAAGNVAVWMNCSLMGEGLFLYIADNVKVREEKLVHVAYVSDSPFAVRQAATRLKMRLLFKRHVGIFPEEAFDSYNEIYYSNEAMEMRAAERRAGWDRNA